MPVNEQKAVIVVASHKPYKMPADPVYRPLFVGAALHPDKVEEMAAQGYAADDTGDNISEKNPGYCELTALYWAWKNLEADAVGLAHYRRHFAGRNWRKRKEDPFDRVLTGRELQFLLQKARVLVPVRQSYYIETLYSHYAHTHDGAHLDLVRQILAEKYADYLPAYDRAVNRTWGYMFNMLVAERDLFDAYCGWLFDILGELETRVDTEGMTSFQQRFYGRVSEILFNVWLERQQETGLLAPEEIREVPYLYMEKINWIRKGTAFLKAKFLRRKYDGSF